MNHRSELQTRRKHEEIEMEKTITDHPQPSLQHAITTVTMISRRTHLTALMIGLGSISGCLQIFDPGGSGGENSSQGNDTGTGEGEEPSDDYEVLEDTLGEKMLRDLLCRIARRRLNWG